MLLTRCPDCDTTFRITDETLKKANGQVRCGRCASVFNAYAELHDPAAKSFDAPAANVAREAEPPSPPAPPSTTHAPPPAAAAAPISTDGDGPVPTEPAAPSVEDSAVADVIAEAALAAAEEDVDATQTTAATASAPQPISPTEIERVLTGAPDARAHQSAPVWSPFGDNLQSQPRSRWWGAAAALALLALGVQLVHHSRADVAGHPTFGAWLQTAYALFGVEVTPRWDVQQYEILDWVATAEPNARGLGSLKITARIQNRGPLRQPYPAVQLKLKDRWEEAVGSRLFGPGEYLPRDAARGQWMSPGETARAEIEVVDPGPDAYGFELDVCIEVEASLVTCGSDAVFL